MKKLVSVLLILFLVINVMPVQSAYAATVKLNKTNINLNVGKTYTLKVTGTKKTVKWSSSDAKIASVSTKGVVKGIKKGSAKITAAVSGKKYTCKVTVKDVFSTKTAIEKLSTEEELDTGKGIFVILKNNYGFDYSLTATAIYYDEAGKMVGKTTNSNYYFEKSKECALFFDEPYDSNYKSVAYDSYKISYVAEAIMTGLVSTLSDIEITSNIADGKVMAEVTNTGDAEPEFTVVSVVFFEGGMPVGYDYTYAKVETAGSTDYIDFDFPSEENGNKAAIDDYKIFVNYSYYYE